MMLVAAQLGDGIGAVATERGIDLGGQRTDRRRVLRRRIAPSQFQPAPAVPSADVALWRPLFPRPAWAPFSPWPRGAPLSGCRFAAFSGGLPARGVCPVLPFFVCGK